MSESDIGRSITREPTERVLTPEELTPVLIATLRELIHPSIKDLLLLVDSNIKNNPAAADFAETIDSAAVSTDTDIDLMTKLSENAIRGGSVQIVEHIVDNKAGQPEDHSYLYLGPKSDGSDVDKESIKTVQNVDPSHLNKLLLRTVNNRTAQSLTIVGSYSEIVSEDMEGDPKKNSMDSIVTSTQRIGEDIQNLMKMGEAADRGEKVKLMAQPTGRQVLSLTPAKAA